VCFMYHTLIYTPKMHRRDGASHLLEHCIGSLFLKEYVKFLNHSQTFEARCLEFYTQFSFEKKEDLEEFLLLLSQKIKKADFEREKQRLEDELFDQSFFDRLRNLFEGEQDRAYPSFSEIRTYQQNYYNNYLILDQNYKIEQKYQNNIHQISSRVPLKNTQILLDKVSYSLFSIPFFSAQDRYFFDFLQRLSSARIDYQTWYVEKLYFPYQHYYSLREEAAYLIFSQGALEHMQKLDWSFFCQFKAYYHANLVSHKWNILAQLLNKKQLQNPEAFIADLPLQRIQSFFAQKI